MFKAPRLADHRPAPWLHSSQCRLLEQCLLGLDAEGHVAGEVGRVDGAGGVLREANDYLWRARYETAPHMRE